MRNDDYEDSRGRRNDDDDRGRRDDDDYDVRRRRNDDDDDDYRARPRQKKSSKLGLILVLSGSALALTLVAVAAFVWPGFARSRGASGAAHDLLSMAPADSFVAGGISTIPSRRDPAFKKQMDDLAGMLRIMKVADEELINVLVDAESLVFALALRGQDGTEVPAVMMALTTLKPYDQEKLKKISFLGAAETEGNVTVHRLKLPPGFAPDGNDLFVAMPTSRLLVAGLMPKADFVKCLQNRSKKPVVSADLLAASLPNDNTFMWMAAANTEKVKKKLKEQADDMNEFAFLTEAKSAGFNFDQIGKDGGYKFEVNVQCGKADDAEKLKKKAEEGWAMLVAKAKEEIAKAGPEVAPFKKIIDEALGSFKAKQSGTSVTASLAVSDKSIKELEQLAQKKGEGAPGMGGMPGQFMAMAALAPAIEKAFGAGNRIQDNNNLKQMALAMHSYHDAYKGLPSAAICDKSGKPLLSWRVAILPFIEEAPLYKEFKLDEPWNSKHNLKLLDRMPKVFRTANGKGLPTQTNYRVFVGNGAGFEWNEKLLLGRHFTDGTSNTVMIVEAEQSVPWTKPDELEYNPKGPLPRFSRNNPKGFHVAFFDASTRLLPHNLQEATIRGIITRDGGEPIGPDLP